MTSLTDIFSILNVGDHTVGFVATAPLATDDGSSTFTVDPSGTGACLQG
jgi:hypothetical protein